MSAFSRALERAHATANRLAGVDVVYRRKDGRQVDLRATIGASRLEHSTVEGNTVVVHVRDYILTVADLAIDAIAFLPETGDAILEPIGGKTFIMEIRPLAGEGKPWDWHGPHTDAVRVHTKQTATE